MTMEPIPFEVARQLTASIAWHGIVDRVTERMRDGFDTPKLRAILIEARDDIDQLIQTLKPVPGGP